MLLQVDNESAREWYAKESLAESWQMLDVHSSVMTDKSQNQGGRDDLPECDVAIA